MVQQRQILGPQDHHERLGGALYRDTRSASQLAYSLFRGQASALFIGAATVGAFMVPAALDITAPLIGLYGTWVLSRRASLPVRLPRGARLRDPSEPIGKTRRCRIGAGDWLLGWDELTNQEIWMSGNDMRNHFLIPGATGSGKTTAILSILTNALCQGSGFTIVDGKASNDLNGRVLSLARKFGREDDVLTLNFITASGDKRSNTWNPFATATAGAMSELLLSQIEPSHGGGEGGNNQVFTDRAGALLRALAPVLVWMREHRGLPINIDTIRFSTELQNIVALVKDKTFIASDTASGKTREIVVADIPEGLLYYLKAYLGETGGFDLNLPYDKQKSDEPSKQHSFVVMNFSKTFTQLGVNLGHIFKCECGDIDMRDVVLNRRILLASLPSLEGTDITNQALGRLVTSSIRAAMAQTMGSTLEGQYETIVGNRPSTAATPYPIILDEAGYYITSGVDTMLAQGRELGFSIGLGFQEVGSFYKRLTENGTAPILGNPQLKIIERLEDSGPTKRWIDGLGGETEVTQVSGFRTNDAGIYADQQQASVRRVARVNWQDVARLKNGEVIILFGGRRIYARLFYADIEPGGAMRVRQGVTGIVAMPAAEAVDEHAVAVRDKIIGGMDIVRPEDLTAPTEPVLAAALSAFAAALSAGVGPEDETRRILSAVSAVQTASAPIQQATATIPAATGAPWHPYGEMLATVTEPGPHARLSPRNGPSHAPDHVNLIIAIEARTGLSLADARFNALCILDCLATIPPSTDAP